jgi:RNA polymerase sigma factor (sigma-70 family)
MTPNELQRLSRIETRWTVVFQAYHEGGDEAADAQQSLVLRYYRAVFRYLRAMVHDPDLAEDLTHEFVVRFLTGEFSRADPARGRFRDFLKRALRNMVIDHWRRQRAEQKKVVCRLPETSADPAAAGTRHRSGPHGPANYDLNPVDDEQAFVQGWRVELLTRAWDALARFQKRTRQAYYTVLKYRADNPHDHGAELARLLSVHLGKSVTEAAFRQLLGRAREKFADFVLAEVACSLGTADFDAIEAELIELDLLTVCRQSLTQARASGSLHGGDSE